MLRCYNCPCCVDRGMPFRMNPLTSVTKQAVSAFCISLFYFKWCKVRQNKGNEYNARMLTCIIFKSFFFRFEIRNNYFCLAKKLSIFYSELKSVKSSQVSGIDSSSIPSRVCHAHF